MYCGGDAVCCGGDAPRPPGLPAGTLYKITAAAVLSSTGMCSHCVPLGQKEK